MIEERTHITELYELKHRNDSVDINKGFDYENNLFKKMFSGLMFENEMLSGFLTLLQKNAVWLIDSTLLIRNWWNYTIDKTDNNHLN